MCFWPINLWKSILWRAWVGHKMTLHKLTQAFKETTLNLSCPRRGNIANHPFIMDVTDFNIFEWKCVIATFTIKNHFNTYPRKDKACQQHTLTHFQPPFSENTSGQLQKEMKNENNII